ncbi:unnamed protein product (macronuclear) [Paramecium tetraurelia]|uniref:RRM domain-containing protein n=1 Tax=Paramecium tetraurelia TaxID=5888 RepID=A0CSX8_PARTE|nr:uncharacterized protein GSPATT00010168001 [Paramecium tetraurelia]CAK73895.1 unnamed protein product [Paramecium tetraurelia]|eukprot:XP_001441292.1 hypothetical protein (macronuclear) [Paramecium tetraurelia strain d4-2]
MDEDQTQQEEGEIQSVKIKKDKLTKQSKGQAFITFRNRDSAEQARKKFNNQVFIENKIRVKPYFNFHKVDKKANIFIRNLPEDADYLELEQEFSRFGKVLSVDVHRDQSGKQLNYGYLQYETKEDAEKLMKRILNHPITHKGKLMKLEKFKDLSERKANQHLFTQEHLHLNIVVRSFEYGWLLVIKDYLTRVQGDQVMDCFVRIDSVTKQPWAIVTFETYKEAKANLDKCEALRKHPCFNSNSQKVIELIKKYGPPVNSDGSISFTIEQITPFFEEMNKDPHDIFKGENDNFFFNLAYNNLLKIDERLMVIQNIKKDVTKDQILEFLSQFGRVISLKIGKTKNSRIQFQQCFVHYQTMQDLKRARSELFDDKNEKTIKQRKEIFKDGHPVESTKKKLQSWQSIVQG